MTETVVIDKYIFIYIYPLNFSDHKKFIGQLLEKANLFCELLMLDVKFHLRQRLNKRHLFFVLIFRQRVLCLQRHDIRVLAKRPPFPSRKYMLQRKHVPQFGPNNKLSKMSSTVPERMRNCSLSKVAGRKCHFEKPSSLLSKQLNNSHSSRVLLARGDISDGIDIRGFYFGLSQKLSNIFSPDFLTGKTLTLRFKVILDGGCKFFSEIRNTGKLLWVT